MLSVQDVFAALFTWKRSKPDTEAGREASPDDRLRAALDDLCHLPEVRVLQENGTGLPGRVIEPVATDKVQRVATTLRSLHMSQWKHEDTTAWSEQPRTYIILHNLDCVHLMNKFVKEGMTDIWLPYSNKTLPSFVHPPEMRTRFLQIQKYVLTNARDLEYFTANISPTKDLRHINLPDGGNAHYKKLKTLGKGSFGVVEEVYSYLSQKIYARKSVPRRRTTVKAQRFLADELDHLKQLSHRHLVKILGSYTDTDYIAYLMEPVAESNLEDFLTRPNGLTDGDKHDVRSFFGCLAGAVNYLHRSRIRHRDLSSRNILVHRGLVIISDFGSAYRWAGTNKQGSMTQHHDIPATSFYMAPEIARKAARNSSSDMWSLGVIFLEMTTLLVGRTLKQLRSKLSDNHRLNFEPYLWANPLQVTEWLQILQQSNQGPAHDNEPLEWIRDLLDPIPKNRPRSGVLMQDIQNTQSFHIFCCIDCQTELQERCYQDNDLQMIDEVSEDAAHMMQDVATILEEVQQPVVISSQSHFTIQSWLADTDATNVEVTDIVDPNTLVSSRMPGEFDRDDDFEYSVSEIEVSMGHTAHFAVVEPDHLRISPTVASPQPTDEDWSPLYPYTSQWQDHSLSTNSEHVKDTGLGFGEIDSPSSSDDDIRVHSDSSGSDADSDDTIVQAHIDQDTTAACNDSKRGSSLILPNFVGIDNKMIQWLASMDSCPEDLDDSDEDSVPRVMTEDEQASSILSEANLIPEEVLANDKRIERTEPLIPEAGVPSLLGGTNITRRLHETTSRPADSKATEGTVTDAVGEPAIATGQATLSTVLEPDVVSELPSDYTKIRHEKNSRKRRSKPARNSRSNSLSLSEANQGPECLQDVRRDQHSVAPQPDDVESANPLSRQGENINLAEMPLKEQVPLNKSRPRKKDKCSFRPHEDAGMTTNEQMPVVDTGSRKREGSVSQHKGGLKLAETPENHRSPHNEPVLSKRKKKSALHVTFAEDASLSTTLATKENQSSRLEISPNDYIRNTWDSASIATSVMSNKTKSILNRLSLDRWLDRDHNLMEIFCSQGKAQAVRALLEKGCNPGKAGPRTQRRSGPIILAVKGASQRHNKCVKALIEAGVDVNVVNKRSGKTPLHLAIENPQFKGYEHLICALIDGGANPNHADIRGDSPIMKIFHGTDNGPLEDHRVKALALLLRNESTDVEATQPGTLNTPLHLAVRRKDPFAVAMLLFKKASINAKNAAGSTPLLVAANQLHNPTSKDQKKLMNILLFAEGILLNEKAGVKEQTALHYAVNAGVTWAVEMLLGCGADPTCRDSEDHDALTLARIRADNDNLKSEDRDIILSRLYQASMKEEMDADVAPPKRPEKDSTRESKPAPPRADPWW